MEVQHLRVSMNTPNSHEGRLEKSLPKKTRVVPDMRSSEVMLIKKNALNIGGHDSSQRTASEESFLIAKDFEFVTLTGVPSKTTRKKMAKKVRTHAMRDYLRRQNQENMTGIVEMPKAIPIEQPSQHKTRFKLDSWTHKTRTKAMNERQAKEALAKAKSKQLEATQKLGNQANLYASLPGPTSFALSHDLDPFNTLSLRLGPLSQRLLVHYNTAYFMNSVAINAEGDFFSYVKTDPALFHSILYLVALHYNLKRGLTDSPECLYHGSQAFRLINERLDDPLGTFSDNTVAAVAMLANKENLDGKYELSKMHMGGLKFMIRSRGGVHNFTGVFQRIITWSDFCFASVWNCQPALIRLPLHSTQLGIRTPNPTNLKASHIFGTQSPIVPIIDLMRGLSSNLISSISGTSQRLNASTDIYNLEYSLLLLNRPSFDDPEPLQCMFSFEAIPLKTAIHLWLWLAIRELSQTSGLLQTLMRRLQDSLEVQLPGWWSSSEERRMWLCWILFVGCITSAGEPERSWFVGELRSVCRQLGIGSQTGLNKCLDKVLWQEDFCAGPCAEVWDEVNLIGVL